MNRIERLRRAALFLTAWSLSAAVGAVDIDTVEIDTASGVVLKKLPFDVPFALTGKAPFGTTRVEVAFVVDPRNRTAEPSAPPLAAGVDGEGRFRVQMEPVAPNHELIFRITFERRLPMSEADRLRSNLASLLRLELGRVTSAELSTERPLAVRGAIVLAFERALNEGQVIVAPRGSVQRSAPSPIFDDAASAESARRELLRLAEPVITAQSRRLEALARHHETAPSFLAEISAVSASSSLRVLIEALEKRPDVDPRNPRNLLFLPPESRRLAFLGRPELEATAEGRSPAEPAGRLEDAASSQDADVIRERYRKTAASLQLLHEWLESLVVVGGENRKFVDALLDSAEVSADDVARLENLARTGRGEISRAEQWAETLQVYSHDVETALAARERAVLATAAEIEAQARDVVLRQTTVTDTASSAAGVYVSLDLGVVFPPELERAALYVGGNVYFRPVNKKASLRERGSLGHRLAATFGLTLTNMKLEDETRYENLLGDRFNLLLGLGVRLTRSVRVGGGIVLFLKNDPNPLVVDRSVAVTPYVSFSIDVDVVGAVRGLQ